MEHFSKKQKTNQTEFRINQKGDRLHVKWKDYKILFNKWIDKKRYCYIKWESYLKEVKGIDTPNFAKITVIENLKSDVDRLDIVKLKTTTVDISKLSLEGKILVLKTMCMVILLRNFLQLIQVN